MTLSPYAKQRLKEIGVAAVLTAAFAIVGWNSSAHAGPRSLTDANGNSVAVIGGRPSGCPHAYCGCGLRKYLGLDDARLNLAWNWAKFFPRTSLRAGVVAVWHHHVALVVSVTGNRMAVLRDYNGGEHLSYVHERSVAGAIFVDPGASRTAVRSAESYSVASF